jgi:hypothetical protein
VTVQLSLDIGEAPRARRHDPATSHAAAESAVELSARHRQIILACLKKHGPMGKDAVAARTRLDGVQVCRRLSEMQRLGQAEPTGKTVSSTSGRAEREWTAT